MNLKITTHHNTISASIRQAINKQMKSGALKDKFFRLTDHIRDLLFDAFIHSDTYHSLTGGHLRGEFGLTDTQVSKLPDLVKKFIDVEIEISSKKGGLYSIALRFSDYDEIDFATDGAFVTEKGDIINWLWWLLSAGDSTIESIDGYNVYFKQGQGRSGMAIMLETDGQSYSIDGYFAGTPTDNWITRTLRYNINSIAATIKEVMNGP